MSLVTADAAYGGIWFFVVISSVLFSDVGEIQYMGATHNPVADFLVLWKSASENRTFLVGVN